MKNLLFVRLLEKIPHGVFAPPLGILYLINPIKESYPKININIFDSMFYKDSEKAFVEYIGKNKPEVVAFSINYTEKDMFFRYSNILRKISNNTKIIVGGTGTTYTPEEFIDHADFVVSGEGEERILSILKKLENKTSNLMDGISYKQNGKTIISRPNTYIKDLDKWGVPAWDMVDLKKYSFFPARNTLVKQSPYASILTSRGCPFICPWCHNYTDNKYQPHRLRSVENIIKELELLKSLGVREIQFLDDTFNIPEKRAMNLFKKIIQRKYHFSISFQGFRLDKASRKLLRVIRKAGGYKIDYGVQHVVKHITDTLNRSNVPELQSILEKNRYAQRLGFLTFAFFIYGFPEETFEDSLINLRFAKKLDADFIGFFKLTPLPGTKYYNEKIRKADIPSIDFNHFNNNPILQVGNLSREEMEYLQSRSYREYYLSRGRIFRLLYKIPKTKYLFLTSFHYLRSMITAFIDES